MKRNILAIFADRVVLERTQHSTLLWFTLVNHQL